MRSSPLIHPRRLHDSHPRRIALPLPTTVYLHPPLTSNVNNVNTKTEKIHPLLPRCTIPTPQTRTGRFSPPLRLGPPIRSG
ncbi:hypothetical protein BT69DRAFT_908371 [Atractiella rhizophila]|nr:hypothetical protein BT69DRAFT_908371 [Atractiella rhizophila]